MIIDLATALILADLSAQRWRLAVPLAAALLVAGQHAQACMAHKGEGGGVTRSDASRWHRYLEPNCTREKSSSSSSSSSSSLLSGEMSERAKKRKDRGLGHQDTGERQRDRDRNREREK